MTLRPTGGSGPAPPSRATTGTVTNDGTTLVITLDFSTPISPPARNATDSVYGYVLLDADHSTATGPSIGALDGSLGLGLGSIPSGQVPSGLGIDSAVSLDSVGGMAPGDVDVIGTKSLDVLASVPIAYTSDSLSFSIPLSDLTDPVTVAHLVNFAAIVGNPDGPTDTLLGVAGQAVPEPSSMMLLAGPAPLLALAHRSQRRGTVGSSPRRPR